MWGIWICKQILKRKSGYRITHITIEGVHLLGFGVAKKKPKKY
jgi:hypothetical protein